MRTNNNPAAKIVVLLAAAVTLFTACAPPATRALRSGQKLLARGKYAEAVEQFKTASTLLGETNAQVFNYLGLACHLAGQAAPAENSYKRALALNPDLSEARYNLGCLYLDENKLEQAKSELTAYTLRRAGAADGWEKLGMAHLRSAEAGSSRARSGEVAAAEKAFNESLRLNPGQVQALVGLGLTRLQKGRAADASQCFKDALTNQPLYPAALLNLAVVSQQYLGAREAALQNYKRYVALKPAPENVSAVQLLVQQLEAESTLSADSAAAKLATKPGSQLPRALSESVQSPANSVSSASNLSQPDRSDQTQSSTAPDTQSEPFSKAPTQPVQSVVIPPDPVIKSTDASVLGQESSTHSTTSQPPHTAQNATEKSSSKITFFQRFNPANLFASREESARSPRAGENSAEAGLPRYHYQHPSRPLPGNRTIADPFFAQAVNAQRAHDLPAALSGYRQAIQRDPAFYDAYYNLALAQLQSGDVSGALGSCEMALAIKPESADARYNFAIALKQGNYVVDSAAELEKLLALFPNDVRSQLALANLYSQQLGDVPKARQHYLKVLELDPRNPQAASIQGWLANSPR